MVFPVVICGGKSWNIKRAKHWRTDAGEDSWESLGLQRDQTKSTLKGINPEYSLEGPMLKLQYFGHPIWRADSLDKNLMLAKTEGKRGRGLQRMRWLESITDSTDINLSKFGEIMEHREAWYPVVNGVTKSWTWLSNWTTMTTNVIILHIREKWQNLA